MRTHQTGAADELIGFFSALQAAVDGKPASLSSSDTVAKLRAAAAGYADHERFRAGDIIQPKANMALHGGGWPHLVLEVLNEPMMCVDSTEDPTRYKDWGQRLDIRFVHMNEGGEIHTHWGESWMFERWQG